MCESACTRLTDCVCASDRCASQENKIGKERGECEDDRAKLREMEGRKKKGNGVIKAEGRINAKRARVGMKSGR